MIDIHFRKKEKVMNEKNKRETQRGYNLLQEQTPTVSFFRVNGLININLLCKYASPLKSLNQIYSLIFQTLVSNSVNNMLQHTLVFRN